MKFKKSSVKCNRKLQLLNRETGQRHDFVPVLHGVSVGEPLHDLGDGGPLLSDGDVDAEELLLVVSGVVETLLVDDGVDGDGGLAGLTIADDQLALSAANGHQGVHGLDAGLNGNTRFRTTFLNFFHNRLKLLCYLHGLLDGLPGDDSRGLDSDPLPGLGLDGSGAVDGVAQGVHHAAQKLAAHGNVHDGAGTLHNVA